MMIISKKNYKNSVF